MPATHKRTATNPHLIALGQRLRRCRLHLNWSQPEVGQRIGLSVSVISDYENGHYDPPTARLNAFATLYGLSTDALLGRVPMPTWLCDDPVSPRTPRCTARGTPCPVHT